VECLIRLNYLLVREVGIGVYFINEGFSLRSLFFGLNSCLPPTITVAY